MSNHSQPSVSSVLHNVRIVLPAGVIESGSVLLNGGRITRIIEGKRQIIAGDSIEHDLSGLTLFPGFIDIHIHGAVGVDTMAATADDLRRVSQHLTDCGVTAWLPTLVPASREVYGQAIESIGAVMREDEESDKSGSRILGVHYEGPFVNSLQCGALHQEYFRTFSGSTDVDALPSLLVHNASHMMTLAPEVEGGVELVRELTKRGWIVSIGHTRAEIEILDQAYAAGARHMTHFMNAMPPLHHRKPGPVGWGLSRADVTCDVIADGVHLDPLMLRLLLRMKSPERLALISDAIAATGAGDGDYQIWGETISVTNGRTRNAQGSIAGSVITMLDAVRMMLSLGVSEVDVAQMASANPARLLRLDKDCGSIEVGKRADLVGLDQDGKVRLTIVNGSVAFRN